MHSFPFNIKLSEELYLISENHLYCIEKNVGIELNWTHHTPTKARIGIYYIMWRSLTDFTGKASEREYIILNK